MTGLKGRSKPPRAFLVDIDPDSNKVLLQVNFSGLAEWVENQLPNGKNNPEFYPTYGQKVNLAVKKGLKLVPLANYRLNFGENKEVYASKMLISIITSLHLLIGLTIDLIRAADIDSSLSVNHFLLTASASEALFLIINNLVVFRGVNRAKKNLPFITKYQEYLLKGLINNQYARLFVPEKIIGDIIFPTCRMMSNKNLIRGK